MSIRSGLVAISVAALAACGVVTGLDGYDVADDIVDGGGGRSEAGAVDSGGPPSNVVDSSTSNPDVGVIADATSDVVVIPDATPDVDAGPRYCSTFTPVANYTTRFCADFDGNDQAPLYGWARRQNVGGDPARAAGGLDSTFGLQARAVAPAGTPATVNLWRSFEGLPANVDYLIEASVKVITAGSYAVLFAVQAVNPNGEPEYGIALYDSPNCPNGSPCLDQNEPTASPHSFGPTTPKVTLGTWYRLKLALDEGPGDNYQATLFVNDVQINSRNIKINQERPELGIGAFFTAAPTTAEVVFDNVVVTTRTGL